MFLIERLRNYLGLVRFAHTVLALPFALISALAAGHRIPEIRILGWILFCMVTARTGAMTFNRIVDRRIDCLNPRTQDRHLPTGQVTLMEAIGLWLVSSALFILGAWMLNFLAFLLSFPALVVICGYSFLKRYSALSHFVLGLSLGIAPIGAWIAVSGTLSWPPVILALGVLLWVAGFDIIYALMDEEFDRRMGLQSLVVQLGKERALWVAFISHLLSVAMVFLFGIQVGFGWIFFAGTIGYAALILYEHHLVDPNDVKRINMAFFNVNGIISIGLFLFALADVVMSR